MIDVFHDFIDNARSFKVLPLKGIIWVTGVTPGMHGTEHSHGAGRGKGENRRGGAKKGVNGLIPRERVF